MLDYQRVPESPCKMNQNDTFGSKKKLQLGQKLRLRFKICPATVSRVSHPRRFLWRVLPIIFLQFHGTKFDQSWIDAFYNHQLNGITMLTILLASYRVLVRRMTIEFPIPEFWWIHLWGISGKQSIHFPSSHVKGSDFPMNIYIYIFIHWELYIVASFMHPWINYDWLVACFVSYRQCL